MKIRSWLAGIVLAMLSVSAAQAATITIVATADAEVFDVDENGVFDGLRTDGIAIQVSNGLVNTRSVGVFEFDLSALPAGAVITGAQFLMRVGAAALDPPDPLDFLELGGAVGDGQLSVGDAAAIVAQLGTLTIAATDLGEHSIALSTPLFAALADTSSLLMLRLQSSPLSGAVAHFITSVDTFSPSELRPSLLIDYDAPAPPAVPEPTTLLLIATGVLPLLRRKRH